MNTNNAKHIGSFYFNTNWFIWVIVFICIIIIGFMSNWGKIGMPNWYNNLIDPFFGLFGVLITIALTFFLAESQWKDSLEKRLIVHYVNTKGQFVASCYNLHVLPNGELRALGQQIGLQMLNVNSLKFNPSVIEREKGRPILIKDANKGQKWVMVYEILYNLLPEGTENDSKKYVIWNISGNQISKKELHPHSKPFHENHLKKEILINDDDTSFQIFENYDKIEPNPIYLLNSSVLTSPGKYFYELLEERDVKLIMKGKPVISSIRHEATREKVSEILETKIGLDQENVIMHHGDIALVCKLKNRTEVGKIYNSDEMNKLPIEWGLLTRIE